MVKLSFVVSLAILLVFITQSKAATPLFLQAITSALATIPFSGGPMTTGLVGAKLGIGTKLLYYLGYFGQRSSPKPKSTPKRTSSPKSASSSRGSGLPSGGGLQPLPLPYMLSGGGGGGGYPGMSNNFQTAPGFQSSAGIDPSQLFQVLTAQGVDPNVVMEALNYAGAGGPGSPFGAGAGGPGGPFGAGGMGNPVFSSGGPGNSFGAGAGGMGNPVFSSGGPGNSFGAGAGGMGNPMFSSGGPGNSFGAGGMGNPVFSSGGPGNQFGAGAGGMGNPGHGINNGFGAGGANAGFPSKATPGGSFSTEVAVPPSENEGNGEGGGSEDVESFFTFLQDMDENTCISRLICDIGQNPDFLGEFSENIHSMVGSLNVEPSSRAYHYMEIMEQGRAGAQCNEKFPECSDMSYEIVKNVAPSVGVPQNVDSAAINQL